MQRWFTIIQLEDQWIQQCLDAMIFLANPREKSSAHITIQGPFANEPKAGMAKKNLQGTSISIYGVGNFFDGKQNTVFLKCDSSFFKTYWRKKHFGYHPHITIYDGPSRDFAERLYEDLKGQRLFFSAKVGRVVSHLSRSGQGGFDVIFGPNFEKLTELAGERIDLAAVSAMPDWKRIMILNRVSANLLADQNSRA